MKKLLSLIAIILLIASLLPASEVYKSSYSPRSGIAHGGIGTGAIELRKDGQFYNWSIFNNYPLKTGPIFEIPTLPRSNEDKSLLFFIVRYQVEGEDPKMKLLQLNSGYNEAGQTGIAYYYPWLERIEQIEYAAEFPYTRLTFSDSDMPLEIDLRVYSPFIPHDVKNSSLPGVYFDFKVRNTSTKKINVFLISSLRNLVGYDTTDKYFTSKLVEGNDYKYFDLGAGGMDEGYPSYGNMGMASLSEESTYYLGWEHKHPYYERLVVENSFPNIDDTEGRNMTDEKTGKKTGRIAKKFTKDQRHFSSIGITRNLDKDEAFEHSFLMTWNFPNAYGSHNIQEGMEPIEWLKDDDYWVKQTKTTNIGNYYNNFFKDAADVAEYMIENRVDLFQRTNQFFTDYYRSDLPKFVLDQVNSNLNTFISSSTLTKAKEFAIREGMSPNKSWGPNGTMDVSLYGSTMIVSLFPELQQSTMRQHKKVQTDKGEIGHGLGYDLNYLQSGTWGVYHRIDLPGNYLQQVMRDYFWTGDKQYLKEIYPSLKEAFYYVLDHRDEDGDLLPDMEGIMCSYDNFPMYGVASYIHTQWLCAVAGLEKAAEIMKDEETVEKAKKVYDITHQKVEEKLWNGEYYRLYNDADDGKGIDEACLTDQIIGQWMAHQSGLGYILDPEKVHASLKNVMKYSFKEDFGLRNCTWPEYPDLYPIHETELWVDQANTCWTGVELGFASFLMYEDMYYEALDVIQSVEERYRENGLYFDHQEFGGHYFRPMSAWGVINGVLGLAINNDHYQFSPCFPASTYELFFAFNNGTAFYQKGIDAIKINVRSGEMRVHSLTLEAKDLGQLSSVTINDKKVNFNTSKQNDKTVVKFKKTLEIKAGQSLILNQDLANGQ
ncbi:MAG: GH116 family glycosyl hydrolase [Fidelibacterota bacterium]